MTRVVALLSVLGLLACGGGPGPRAADGVVDLRDWDFESGRVLSLQGEWELYWERLMEPVAIMLPAGSLKL